MNKPIDAIGNCRHLRTYEKSPREGIYCSCELDSTLVGRLSCSTVDQQRCPVAKPFEGKTEYCVDGVPAW